MKQKTHSGAKKRLQLTASGLVKRKQTRKRHLLSSKSAKRKRHLTGTLYVHEANMNQMRRVLNF